MWRWNRRRSVPEWAILIVIVVGIVVAVAHDHGWMASVP